MHACNFLLTMCVAPARPGKFLKVAAKNMSQELESTKNIFGPACLTTNSENNYLMQYYHYHHDFFSPGCFSHTCK